MGFPYTGIDPITIEPSRSIAFSLIVSGTVGTKSLNAVLQTINYRTSRESIPSLSNRFGYIWDNNPKFPEMVESELASISQAEFFSDSNDLTSIKSIQDSVRAIHAEAAALDVFAKSFRANIK